MKDVVVKFKRFREGAQIPHRAHEDDSGFDLYAWLPGEVPIVMEPGERWIIRTGLNVQIPKGYEIQVRPRSGLAVKHGLTVLNAPGTIDSSFCPKPGQNPADFEVCVILVNHDQHPFTVEHNMRIAQMVVCKLPSVELEEVEDFVDVQNTRTGGFGSSGVSMKQ